MGGILPISLSSCSCFICDCLIPDDVLLPSFIWPEGPTDPGVGFVSALLSLEFDGLLIVCAGPLLALIGELGDFSDWPDLRGDTRPFCRMLV